ncbi:NUDIX hydrolase [Pullulanibacillus sp. KACC 23026]|uniref:NUDIX hydrolase n=1 Tax=Pullulanibacillus sp. KACC 23026 TaxID=3028315 RepID=UPI0023AF0A2D|nr:NUDIX hydrolase [Pullulanibacillus sp. KACC 23026]WEG12236.1 NUDIX hydrolase [Pullulanibacillus sp. KACC 23026]
MSRENIILVVSVSIFKDDKVLIIKEDKPIAINKWNFPGGRIEYGEDILDSAKREVKEETGFDVSLINTTGVYNFNSITDNQVILFHFTAEIVGGTLKLEEEEIVDSKWIKLNELSKMEDKDLREPHVIRQIIESLLNDKLHSTCIFKKQLL